MSTPTVETQNLTRSFNEALILAALRAGPKHGYQLALDIEERSGHAFRLNHGTLYPILHKLEKDGLIRGTWSSGGSSRRRKSYTLTARGERHAREQVTAWRGFVQCFFAVVELSP